MKVDTKKPRNICPHCKHPVEMKDFVLDGYRDPDTGKIDDSIGCHMLPGESQRCGALIRVKRRGHTGEIRKVVLMKSPDFSGKIASKPNTVLVPA